MHPALAKFIVNCAMKSSTWNLVGPMLFTPTKKGKNIRSLRKQGKTNAMRFFLSPHSSKSSSVNQKEGPLSPQSSLKSAKVGLMAIQKGLLSTFVLDKNAEIIWSLNVAKSHHSFRSCDSLTCSKLCFQTMPFLTNSLLEKIKQNI